MALAKSYTIVVDTQEKKALPFPPFIVMKMPVPGNSDATTTVALHPIDLHLPTADYALPDYALPMDGFSHHWCLVETKRGLGELYKNLFTDDRVRFEHELLRMTDECKFPIVLVENTLSRLLTPTKDYPEPFVIMDELQRICYFYKVHLMLAPASNRLLIGEFVARLLINATL